MFCGDNCGHSIPQVEKNADAWEEGGGGASLEADSNQLRPLIGTVTSCDRDGGFINQTTFFPREALCDGTVNDQNRFTPIYVLLFYFYAAKLSQMLYLFSL